MNTTEIDMPIIIQSVIPDDLMRHTLINVHDCVLNI